MSSFLEAFLQATFFNIAENTMDMYEIDDFPTPKFVKLVSFCSFFFACVDFRE